MAKPKKELACQPNWLRIKELVDESEWNGHQISTIVGKSKKWYAEAVKNNSKTELTVINTIATLFKANVDDLLIKEEPKKEEPKEEPKTPDAQMMHKLLEVEAKMDKIIELLAGLSKQGSQPADGRESIRSLAKKPRNVKAKMLLAEMVDEGYGKCLMTSYVKELLSINIGSSYVEQAIKDCGYQKGTTGLGANTVTWIIDPTWEGASNGKQI